MIFFLAMNYKWYLSMSLSHQLGSPLHVIHSNLRAVDFMNGRLPDVKRRWDYIVVFLGVIIVSLLYYKSDSKILEMFGCEACSTYR